MNPSGFILTAKSSEVERSDLSDWPISVIPDGDHHIFLAEDFSFGTFGHPWEQTICVFGQQLIDAVELNKPSYFEEVRRKPNRVLDSHS